MLFLLGFRVGFCCSISLRTVVAVNANININIKYMRGLTISFNSQNNILAEEAKKSDLA